MTNLQRAREGKGLTLLQVAAAAGMDPSTVSRVERGKQTLRPKKAQALANVLGLPVVDVIFCKEASAEPSA